MTQDILQLQSSAQKALQITRDYLLSMTLKTSAGWGLQQFLDEIKPGSTYIGVYGTSCGISSLLICGENPDSPFIQNFKAWLIQHQEKEGGWTLSTFRSKDILITSTCYVINALHDAGETFQSSIIQDGLNWLQKNQNPDRGWGFYEADTISKTTSTAHVIRTFSKFPEMLRTQSARDGINWLLKTRNADYGWGGDPSSKSVSTAGHTSLVIEALVAAGYPAYSSDIQEPIQFLLGRFEHPSLLITEADVFYVNHPDGTATGMHYHLPSLSLMASALLNAEIDPLRTEVTRLIKIIISNQQSDGYWLDNRAQGKIPIWATMYSVRALRNFVQRVDAVRETLGVRQSIVDLTQIAKENQTQIKEIANRLASLEQKTKPIYSVLSFVRKFRVVLALMVTAIVYVLVLKFTDDQFYANIAGGILGIFTTLIGIYDARHVEK